VLKLDPDYAKRRKDEDRKYAHVRRFREHSGNAGMVAHEMPPDEVLASWQHVEQRALDLRAAGMPGTPGEVGAFGLIDAPDARDLVAAAAKHPRTRWCITALNPDGTAAAHGCASGRHPPPGRANLTVTSGPGLGPDPPAGTRPQDYLRSLGSRLVPVARGHCDHAQAEPGYRPSRKLQHLVRARSARCTAPGCGRPAARCDLDHTVPWDQGGITCECDLAPPCKR